MHQTVGSANFESMPSIYCEKKSRPAFGRHCMTPWPASQRASDVTSSCYARGHTFVPQGVGNTTI